MKIDDPGHIVCTGPGGLHFFAPEGACLGVLRTPARVANFTWGDEDLRTLYLCRRRVAAERADENRRPRVMQVTHFGHACVLVEQGTARILIDPGEWSDGFGGLRDLDGILITHRHPDHLDVQAVAGLARDNPEALQQASQSPRTCSLRPGPAADRGTSRRHLPHR